MDVKRRTTITITPDEIKQMITDALKKEGHDVSNCTISFEVRSCLEGYGMAEHEVVKFKGADVYLN